MRNPRRVYFPAGLLGMAGLLMFLSSLAAQGDKASGEKVRFTTVDGVEIQGTSHQASKPRAPTVLLLHPLNEDSNKKAWITLAEDLKKSGYSVLRFDFRGHGQSTGIEAETFWKFPHNIKFVRGYPKKSNIEYKDMSPAYFPALVNDIAAAKSFLDNRHDAGLCNTASTIVIGAESGAILGGIWLNSEWHRFRFEPPAIMFGNPEISKRPEGKDVIACIWLSAGSKLGSRTLTPSRLYDLAAREGATPMVFMYSDGDTAGKTIAKGCESKIKGSKKDDKKYPFTAAVEIKEGKTLKGMGLLQKSLGTNDAIVAYIQEVVQAKGNEWGERDFRKSQFFWILSGAQPIPAKSKTEKNLIFDTYEKFIPR